MIPSHGNRQGWRTAKPYIGIPVTSYRTRLRIHWPRLFCLVVIPFALWAAILWGAFG